jgi:NAD(P)-dependent dehydrogenase (short-subunit alcohol dehydrogenase family)
MKLSLDGVLEGKTVLLTGANGNLGRKISSLALGLGADLVAVDLFECGEDHFRESMVGYEQSKISVVKCDLSSDEERKNLHRDFSKFSSALDVLVNNAAFVGTSKLPGWNAPFSEQTIDTWRLAFEVNLTACFHLCQLFEPFLSDSASGNIINIGSIYGEYGPDWRLYDGVDMANPAAYAASKGGLHQLTRWLATTLAPDIRVNTLAPGGIEMGQAEEFKKRYSSRVPLQRMATIDDLAGTVVYLMTPMSNYVTGQTISVDGGWGIW